MTHPDDAPEQGFADIGALPPLDRVMDPVITVAGRSIHAVVTTADDDELRLRFQPYQAMRVTTIDCFAEPDGLPHRVGRIAWSARSAYLDELTTKLAEVDHTATFMERAVHFVIPAGDDVLEVVAWRMTVERPDGTTDEFPRQPTR